MKNILRSKHLIGALLSLLLGTALSSCRFLDIIPDGTATNEDAFKNPMAAKRYLYSCYGFIPMPSSGTGCMAVLSGDQWRTASSSCTHLTRPTSLLYPLTLCRRPTIWKPKTEQNRRIS